MVVHYYVVEGGIGFTMSRSLMVAVLLLVNVCSDSKETGVRWLLL